MLKVQKRNFLVCLATTLIIGVIAIGSANASIFGLFKDKKKDAAPQVQSLLVFPFDQDASIKLPSAFGEDVASSLRNMLLGNRTYSVFIYRAKLAPIKRATDDNAIKPQDAVSPFADDTAKSLKLAQLLATDFYLVGSIDDCKIDVKSKTGQMTLRADLYNCKSGKLVKTFLITGKAPEAATTSSSEDLQALAAGDAVAKLKLELVNAGSASDAEDSVSASTINSK